MNLPNKLTVLRVIIYYLFCVFYADGRRRGGK